MRELYPLAMVRILKSLGFALEGLLHAIKRERNLQLFTVGYVAVLLIAAMLPLERLTDAVDALPKEAGNTKLHLSMKAAKDVSAAAALMGLATAVITMVLILGPKLLMK